MADQVERIVLEIDDAKALLAMRRTNDALERAEKKAGLTAGSLGRVSEAVEKAGGKAQNFGDRLRQALESPRGALDGLIGGLTGIPGIIAAATVAVAGFAVGVYKVVGGMTDWAEQLGNVSIATGLSRQEVQLFTAAANAQGVSVDLLQNIMRGLSKTIEDTSPAAQRTRDDLAKMGVAFLDVNGRVRNTGQVLLGIADALGKIEDPFKRAAKAQEIFGRGGVEALKLFNNGLRETIAEFERLGLALNENALAPIDAMDKKLDRAAALWESFGRRAKAAIVDLVDAIPAGSWIGRMISGEVLVAPPAPSQLSRAGAINRIENFARRQDAQSADITSGSAIVAAFQRQRAQGLPGLQSRLTSLTEDRATALGRIGPGLGEAAARTAVAEVQRLDKEIASVQARIKAITEAPAKAEAALRQQEALEKSLYQKRLELIRESEKVALDAAAKESEERIALEGRIAERRTEYQRESGAIQDRIRQQGFDQELIALQRSRDEQIRSLEGLTARTVNEKIALEQRKLAVEVEFLKRSQDLKLGAVQRQNQDELDQAYRLAETKEDLENRLAIVRQDATMREKISAQDAAAAMAAAQQESVTRQTQLMNAQYDRTFDRIQDSFGGLLDAMLSRSRSWGSALLGMLQAVWLTPIKEGLSMMVAGALTGRGTGARAGGLGGLFGALPVLGGIGSAGAPGGTPGFAGPVGGIGSLAQAGGLGGLARGGITAAGVAPLALGGALLGGLGAFKLGQRGGIGGALAPGLGAVSGLLGFGALTALFPSLLAAGPAGWIAAGGIGAFVGLMGLWRGKAEDKVREKIKQVYGVTIREKNILQQIMAIAKEGFGGNIDVAIRSQPVKDIIDLYQMTFGGARSGLSSTPQPVSTYQSGGQVYQSQGAYSTGSSAVTARSAGVTVVMPIQVVGAREFLTQETTTIISNNGRAVVNSAMKAQRANVGRTRFTQNQLAPNLITS